MTNAKKQLIVRSPDNAANFSPVPQTGYLRLPEVLHLFPVSKSTWWAGVKAGKYPASIKLSQRVTAWRVEDINRLLNGDQ